MCSCKQLSLSCDDTILGMNPFSAEERQNLESKYRLDHRVWIMIIDSTFRMNSGLLLRYVEMPDALYWIGWNCPFDTTGRRDILRDSLKHYYRDNHVEASEVFPLFMRLFTNSCTPHIVKDAVSRFMCGSELIIIIVECTIRNWSAYGRLLIWLLYPCMCVSFL